MTHEWIGHFCIKCNVEYQPTLIKAVYGCPNEVYERYANLSNSEFIDKIIPCISDEEWIVKQLLE